MIRSHFFPSTGLRSLHGSHRICHSTDSKTSGGQRSPNGYPIVSHLFVKHNHTTLKSRGTFQTIFTFCIRVVWQWDGDRLGIFLEPRARSAPLFAAIPSAMPRYASTPFKLRPNRNILQRMFVLLVFTVLHPMEAVLHLPCLERIS